VSMFLLKAGAKESLNVKGAYFEVVADAAGSVGVIIAALLVAATGDSLWDTLVALAIGIFVAVRAVVLGRQVLAVLGQQVPEGLDINDVTEGISAIPGIADVHDFHAWTLTSGMNVATAHLVLLDNADAQDVLQLSQQMMREKFGIEHATLQVEERPTKNCHDVTW